VVHLGGPVKDDRLKALYQGAVALVYPSRYEGFGLPLIEAMACGTPVIASNAASMPEVVGDAGVLLDPTDETAWTRAITRFLTDPDERRRLSQASLARAAAFSWDRTARATFDVYRRVARR
jgi:alpha-1,3-rhamnosyl/mannosyltransferase